MSRFTLTLALIGTGLFLATWAANPLPMFPERTRQFHATWPNPNDVRYDDQGRRLESEVSHWPAQSERGFGVTGIWR